MILPMLRMLLTDTYVLNKLLLLEHMEWQARQVTLKYEIKTCDISTVFQVVSLDFLMWPKLYLF